jgi:hypothetical protein
MVIVCGDCGVGAAFLGLQRANTVASGPSDPPPKVALETFIDIKLRLIERALL